MSGITSGVILTIISAIGLIVCIAGLIATITIFPKQRKKMLEKTETE